MWKSVKSKFDQAVSFCKNCAGKATAVVAAGGAVLLATRPAQAVLDPDIAAAFVTLDTAVADLKTVAWASLITIIVIFASMTIFKKFVGKIFGK